MSKHTKERCFGGVKFVTTTLDAKAGFPLSVKVGKIFAPILLDPEFRLSADLAQYAGLMFQNLAPDDAVPLAQEMFQRTEAHINGKRWELSNDRGFDEVFTGALSLLLSVMVFVAEVNFGNFFDAVSASDPADNPPEESNSSSTTTSPNAGPSGDST